MSKAKTNLIKYGGCAAFVALLAWLYISQRDLPGSELVDKYLILCDAFTVPGMLLLMFGCLMWASTTGVLDGLTYCVRSAVFALIPGKRMERHETYADYVEHRRENRVRGYGFLFLSGAVTMVIALVFMALYYSVYK